MKDDVGVTDLQVLTVQVTDVNEPPHFLGNLAKGKICWVCKAAQMVASGKSPGDREKEKVNKQADVFSGKGSCLMSREQMKCIQPSTPNNSQSLNIHGFSWCFLSPLEEAEAQRPQVDHSGGTCAKPIIGLSLYTAVC